MAGIGGIGSSSSETTQKTLNVDNRIVVSDQGVAYTPKNSGNQRNIGNSAINVKKGGVYNVTNTVSNSGLDEVTLKQIQGLLNAPSAPGLSAAPPMNDGGVGQVVADRVIDQVENAPDEAKKAKSNYILFGAIFLVVVLAIALGLGKKKK